MIFRFRTLTVETMECRLKTLDSLDLAPTFIKIDVEGFEYDVLSGGFETLTHHEPVIMIERLWQDMRVSQTLTDLGYREVILESGRFRPRTTPCENAFRMTDRHLALSLTASC